LQGDAVFERKKKLDEYYIGRARCQAESATGAGFALSRCNILRTSPKKPYKTLNDRGTLYKARPSQRTREAQGSRFLVHGTWASAPF